jgi:hypothetical protein
LADAVAGAGTDLDRGRLPRRAGAFVDPAGHVAAPSEVHLLRRGSVKPHEPDSQDGAEGVRTVSAVAQALEILGERWTLLVVREMLSGSRRFSEIQRGVPLMSPTLAVAATRPAGEGRNRAPSW